MAMPPHAVQPITVQYSTVQYSKASGTRPITSQRHAHSPA